MDDMSVRAHITEAFFNQVTQVSCAFGKVDISLIKNLANTYFSDEEYEILPMLNNRLSYWLTLPIPSDFFQVFKLTNLTVQYHDGYLLLGTTPIFMAPIPDQLQDSLIASQQKRRPFRSSVPVVQN